MTTTKPHNLKAEITGKALQSIEGYLKSNRAFLSQHGDFDDFIDKYVDAELDAEKDNASREDKNRLKSYTRANKLLGNARLEIQKVLWRHEVFLSINIIERILFELALDSSITDISDAFFQFVFTRKLHAPGFVLYPIHSFGIQGFGFASLFSTTLPDIDLPGTGIVICAQTNNPEGTLDFLDRVRTSFGITQSVPDDFRWELNRDALKWLTSNPLLAVKISSTTSGYYENQLVIMVKLKLATALLQMLAALGKTDRVDTEAYNLSTARTNNWQTLDIHHYIVFESASGYNDLRVLRTPMNLSRAELTSLAEVNVDVDPHDWAKDDNKFLLERTKSAIECLERGYFASWILGKRHETKARVLRKIYLSVEYFHRSFRSAQQTDEAVIALAIAFETLLTDGYQRGGVKARVARRVRLSLSAELDADLLCSAVQHLMERRGNVVHEGASEISIDMNAARRAFVLCFFAVIERITSVREGASQPVGELLGDQPAKITWWIRVKAKIKTQLTGIRPKA